LLYLVIFYILIL